MANPFFQFKQFTVYHDRCAMKVTTDACLFGAWLAAQLVQRNIRPEKGLDIGTGTGLLPLMLSQQVPLKTEAVEIDPEAAAQAAANCNASPWKDNIRIIQSDIKSYSSSFLYDLVFSNPPFYENEWQSADGKKNTAHHSLELTLEDVFSLLKKWLKPGGHFAFLLPAKREKEIDVLLKKNDLFLWQKTKVRQSVSHDYFRLLLLGTNRETGTSDEDEISIRDRDGAYTPEFISLLKDYYLYL